MKNALLDIVAGVVLLLICSGIIFVSISDFYSISYIQACDISILIFTFSLIFKLAYKDLIKWGDKKWLNSKRGEKF